MKFNKINLSRLFERGGYTAYKRNSCCSCNSSSGIVNGGACRENAQNRYNTDAQNGNFQGSDAHGYNGGSAAYGTAGFNSSNGRKSQGYSSGSAPGENLGYNSPPSTPKCTSGQMRDRGNEPIVFDIRKEAFMTPDFRTSLWTGGNLQLTVMTIPVGEEIGVEMHEGLDQLIGVISGAGEVVFGNRENYFAPPLPIDTHSVVLIPAGTYHNVKNVGKTPLKLYSVYAPKAHKFGTVEKTNTHT